MNEQSPLDALLVKGTLAKLIKLSHNTSAPTLGCGLMGLSVKAWLSRRQYDGVVGHPDGPKVTLLLLSSFQMFMVNHSSSTKTQMKPPDCIWQHKGTESI